MKSGFQAMILAAGLGTRLRPHTLVRPKPLMPVLDRPLLLRAIDGLRRAGCGSLLVNAFHLREQISARLADEPAVAVQMEEKELGTGGGLRRALSRFEPEPVLVVNGDIVHNIDYRQSYARHLTEGNDATLVLHDSPRYNNVLTDPGGNILAFGGGGGEGEQRLLAFTGLQVINPALLELIPPDLFYSSIEWYRQLIAVGYRVRALVVKDHFWTDIGTPRDYLQLHASLLNGTTPLYQDEVAAAVSATVGGSLFCGSGVRLGREFSCRDWVVLGHNAVVGDRVTLSRCVVWDGVTVPSGTTAEEVVFS